MNKYIVKNQNNKQNKNVFGITDYDIPMFGFKSALLILVNGFTYLHIDFRLPNALISGLACGLSVAYSQYFIERKEGLCKNFWLVTGLFSLMAFVLILMIK